MASSGKGIGSLAGITFVYPLHRPQSSTRRPGALTSIAAATKSLASLSQYTHRLEVSAQPSAQYEQRSVCASRPASMKTGHDPQNGQYPRSHLTVRGSDPIT